MKERNKGGKNDMERETNKELKKGKRYENSFLIIYTANMIVAFDL